MRKPATIVNETETDSTTFIGQKFEVEGRTFQIWKYTQPMGHSDPGEYDAVALIDPTKSVGTVPYAITENGPLHKLENVDPNTHVSIPANKIRSVLKDPTLLVLKKIIRPKSQ